jgi:hypothetical protein
LTFHLGYDIKNGEEKQMSSQSAFNLFVIFACFSIGIVASSNLIFGLAIASVWTAIYFLAEAMMKDLIAHIENQTNKIIQKSTKN